MPSLNTLFEGWRLAGVVLAIAGAGASAMAATVNTKLAHHSEQTDSLLVYTKRLEQLERQQLCILVGIEPKIACLQK